MPAPTAYSARFDTATLVQQGRDEVVVCPTTRAGQAAAPVGGTVSLLDANGEPVIDAEAVTVTDNVATYEIDGSDTAEIDLSRDYRIVWVLEMPDGVHHTFDNRAVVCRRVPFPVVSESSLYARVRGLDPSQHAPISKRTEYSSTIDDAWIVLVNRLVEAGKRIELVLDPSVYREAHLTLTLAMVFDDLAARNATYAETAKRFREQYETAWGTMALPTDVDDDGDEDRTDAARGPVWAM